MNGGPGIRSITDISHPFANLKFYYHFFKGVVCYFLKYKISTVRI